MGLFSRKTINVDRTLIEKEMFKYFAREISNTLDAEYLDLEESIKDRKGDGFISDADLADYETGRQKHLDLICKFINRECRGEAFGGDISGRVQPNEIQLRQLVSKFETENDLQFRKISEELDEIVIYFIDSVKSDKFIMMPNATIESSNRYRAYLLGNNLNGDLGWGWSNEPKINQEKIDNEFTQFIGQFVTNVADKVGESKILESASHLGSALVFLWIDSLERQNS